MQVQKHELTGGIDCLQPGPVVSNGVRVGTVDTTARVGLDCGMLTAIAVYEHTGKQQALSSYAEVLRKGKHSLCSNVTTARGRAQI